MVLADGVGDRCGDAVASAASRSSCCTSLASLLFLMFGLWMLFDSALGWRSVAIAVIAVVALAVVTAAAAQTLRRRRTGASFAGRSPETV